MNSLKPRKPYAQLLTSLAVALTVVACGGGGGGGGTDGPDVVDVTKPDELMSALDNKVTSGGVPLQQIVGQPPVSNAATPKVEDVPNATAEPGAQVSLPITLAGAPDLAALFAKIPNASSYFQATVAPEGGKAAAIAHAKSVGGFIPVTTVDFKIDVPANAGTGQFCIDVKFKDTAGNIGETKRACVNVVADAPEQPANDQPSNANFGAALLGTWASNCFDIDDEDNTSDYKGIKLLLTFSTGKVYAESFSLYGTTTCTGQAETLSVIDGAWSSGNAVYDEQAGRWQRPFDFNPNDPDPELDLEPCYNVLSLNAAANRLYLGLPSTFTYDFGQDPMPGDCSAEDLRPTSVIVGLPFIKQ